MPMKTTCHYCHVKVRHPDSIFYKVENFFSQMFFKKELKYVRSIGFVKNQDKYAMVFFCNVCFNILKEHPERLNAYWL